MYIYIDFMFSSFQDAFAVLIPCQGILESGHLIPPKCCEQRIVTLEEGGFLLLSQMAHSGHVTNQDTLSIRTPGQSGHLTNQDTSPIRAPHQSGHLTNQDTSPIKTPHQSRHLTNQDTSPIKTPHQSGHLTNQDTSPIRTPPLSTQQSSIYIHTHRDKDRLTLSSLIIQPQHTGFLPCVHLQYPSC